MQNTIVPTVGRMVYFKTRGSADGVYPPTDFAAIITKVYNPTCVSLAVFGEAGLRFEMSVPQGQEAGCWDWMPFQKDQQARLSVQSTEVNTEKPAEEVPGQVRNSRTA